MAKNATDGASDSFSGKAWRKGKSYKKHSYTVADIATITGRSVGTVRNDMAKKRFDIEDFKSVVTYASEYLR